VTQTAAKRTKAHFLTRYTGLAKQSSPLRAGSQIWISTIRTR